MAVLTKHILDRVNRIGHPQRCLPLNSNQEDRLSAHLPGSFMNFLRKYGFGDYFNRKITYVDPFEFSSILAIVFGSDSDFSHKDCFVVAHSAFGRLICWSKRHDHFEIDLVDLRVTSSKIAPTEFVQPANLPKRQRSTDADVLARSLLPYDERDYEEFDAEDQPMFARCVAAYGTLDRGECYGYFPAMAMAGAGSPMRRVENIKRVKALEHFAILAQLGTFHLMRLERGQYTSVRPIG